MEYMEKYVLTIEDDCQPQWYEFDTLEEAKTFAEIHRKWFPKDYIRIDGLDATVKWIGGYEYTYDGNMKLLSAVPAKK